MGRLGTWEFADSMAGKAPERRAAAAVTVERVDADGTVWASVAGGAGAFPCMSSTVECEPGMGVSVEVSNGRARVTGSTSSPAISAARARELMTPIAAAAQQAANGARVAQQQAESATQSAATAEQKAQEATGSANIAKDAADEALAKANEVNGLATQAVTDAASAKDSASDALTSAKAAAYGLSDVEKVVGTLNWIAEHGEYVAATETSPVAGRIYYTRSGEEPGYRYDVVLDMPYSYEPTADEEPDAAKTYYTRDGGGTDDDPYTYTAVDAPDASAIASYYELREGDPSALGYYWLRMDEAVAGFLASHLWQDAYGLNLALESTSYRAHIGTVDGSHEMGLHVRDGAGDVVASFSDKVALGVAGKCRAVFDEANVTFYDAAGDMTAYFGAFGSTIGNPATKHAVMSRDGLAVSSANVAVVADLDGPISDYATLTIFEASYLVASVSANCAIVSDTFAAIVEGGATMALLDADNVIFYDGYGTAAANVTAMYGRHGMKATVTIGDLR